MTVYRRNFPVFQLFVPFFLPATYGTILNVSIVAIGYTGPAGYPSLSYAGPPMSVATEHVQRKYADAMNFTLHFVSDPSVPNCVELGFNSERMLAEWHYRKRDKSALTVYIVPEFIPWRRNKNRYAVRKHKNACVESNAVPYFMKEWDILWFSTIAAGAQIRNRILNPSWIYTAYISIVQCAELYGEVLKLYKWTAVFFVADKGSVPMYYTLASVITDHLQVLGGFSTTVRWITTKPGARFGKFDPILEDIKATSRVIFYFGHAAFLREFLVAATRKNMTNGEYVRQFDDAVYREDSFSVDNPSCLQVYFAVEPQFNRILLGNLDWSYRDADDPVAFQAFQSLFVLHPSDIGVHPKGTLGVEFSERSLRDFNFTYPVSDPAFISLAPNYATMIAFAEILNESLANGKGMNGAALARSFLNRSFDSQVGTMYFDDSGERRSDLTISYFNSSAVREPFLLKSALSKSLVKLVDLKRWANASFPPPNQPECGFTGQSHACRPQDKELIYTVIFTLMALFLTTGGALFAYARHVRRTAASALLFDPWWQVHLNTIPKASYFESAVSSLFVAQMRKHGCINVVRTSSENSFVSNATKQSIPMFPYMCALHNGNPVVAFHLFQENSLQTFDRLASNLSLLRLLRKFKKLEHANISRFYGLTITGTNHGQSRLSAVVECPSRGALTDICNSFVATDFAFASSLIVDLLDAVEYIHSSSLRYHGQLSILACWVDKHFTLKVTKVAFDRLKQELRDDSAEVLDISQTAVWESLYWTTFDTDASPTVRAMQSVDIFSSGLIIYEILTKCALYKGMLALDQNELHNSIKECDTNPLPKAANFKDLTKYEPVIRSCWRLDPVSRPNIHQFRARIAGISQLLNREMGHYRLIDKFHNRLADYSANLEKEVAHRSRSLKDEMAKCDAIIGQFLPRIIVNQLRAGLAVSPEYFDCVTIMFTDLCGFADFVTSSSPQTTIALISETEACIDGLTSRYDVYKVEAVFDSYMVASGLPVRNGNTHAQRIATFALKLMEAEPTFTFLKNLRFRIGAHSGSCAAGVMGSKRPRYCLFGDTINMASRMCSHGMPGRIHLSPANAMVLNEFIEFVVEPRGMMAIKGKSEMITYWLLGSRLA